MNYDVSQWGKITVPGNWQTQGYGIPIYINIDYPFVKNRPSVTTEPPKDWTAYENRNPVGSYVTFIDVTEEMLGKNLILHFGGVHSAMSVGLRSLLLPVRFVSMATCPITIALSSTRKYKQ